MTIDASPLILAALGYAGSMVLQKTAEKAVEDAYSHILAFISARLGKPPASPASAIEAAKSSANERELVRMAEAVFAGSSALRRARQVAPILNGARLLWVDDRPDNNTYERALLDAFGIRVDVRCSTADALWSVSQNNYHVLISDIARPEGASAGLDLLVELRSRGYDLPVVFYVGHLKPGGAVPGTAFGITNRPDDLLHLVLDVLERACA